MFCWKSSTPQPDYHGEPWGLCQQMPTLGEEIAKDRKFEFIQVLKRKLTESSKTIRVGEYNRGNIKYGCLRQQS